MLKIIYINKVKFWILQVFLNFQLFSFQNLTSYKCLGAKLLKSTFERLTPQIESVEVTKVIMTASCNLKLGQYIYIYIYPFVLKYQFNTLESEYNIWLLSLFPLSFGVTPCLPLLTFKAGKCDITYVRKLYCQISCNFSLKKHYLNA